MQLSPIRRRLLVAGLLAWFVVAGANSLVRESATFDETAHLAAGATYLETGDFRLNPEHPPLSKVWAAVPLWLLGRAGGNFESAAWIGHPVAPGSSRRTGASQWVYGFEWLNGPLDQDARLDPRRRLFPGRLAMLVPGVLLGLIAYAWSSALWGVGGGLLTLFLFALSPTMLAHARLVTTDLPVALGLVLPLWTLWRLCARPGPGRASVFAVSVVPAVLTKFSSLLLAPLAAIVGLACLLRPPAATVRRRTLASWLAAAVLLAAVAAYAGLWAGYGFRFAASADPQYELDWQVVGMSDGPAATLVRGALDRHLLPEAYLYGVAYFLGGAERRVAYLNGRESLVGWWYYFPEAFVLKTPPALMLLLVWTAGLAFGAGRWRSTKAWCVALPVLFYFGVSAASNLNIGHRHLTPVYPLLFVLCGAVARFAAQARWARIVLGVLLLSYTGSFVVATPGYLSYFNFLAGGREGGSRYLLDSNIDWGQDLPRLHQWMERHGVERVHLAYFGTADPRAYGIDYEPLLMVHDFRPSPAPVVRPRSGEHVAVSLNLLHGLYVDQDRRLAEELLRRGWITGSQLQEWVDYRDRLSLNGRNPRSLGEWLVGRGRIDELQLETATSALLSTWIEGLGGGDRRPVGRAGASILVYQVP